MKMRALCAAMLMAAPVSPGQTPPPPSSSRPNIIFVLIDDLRWDEVEYPFVRLPNLQRIAREGVRFRNAFVTTPLCSPSRASFLTGQYAHRHGITDNTDRSARSHQLVTFPRLLREAGYQTAFVGKWHMGVDDTARPGIDHWVSVKGQGRYLDPEFNINGTRVTRPGYFTDILNQFAVEFLRQPRTRPFLLYVSHKSVHPDITQYADGSTSANQPDTFLPAERHKDLYHGAPIPRRPNYGRAPVGKPALERKIGDLPPLGPDTVTDDETIRKRLRMLASADEGLGLMMRVLEEQGQLENTLIIFTSDEGYFYGEHGLSEERRLAYEESARIPLYMRLPRSLRQGGGPAGKPGSAITPFVLSIDVAPTLLEMAGAPPAPEMDGRSLMPLLRGKKNPWRKSFLIEYFSDTVFPRVHRMGYQSVRTERWSYIHYTDLEHMDELYDLRKDPYQLRNLIADLAAQPALKSLQAELARLLADSR
jgi:N-acetylglucosamine-6-sulfatase